MATYTIQATSTLALAVTYTEKTLQNFVQDRLVAGSGNFKKLQKSINATGTAANQGKFLYHDQLTVQPATNTDLILNSATNTFVDAFQLPLQFTAVKWFLLRLTAPAAGVRIVLGNAAGQPWPAWFGQSNQTMEVRDELFMVNQIDGWTVVAQDKLRFNNPTASAITFDIAIIGS
jgi:hypothetical protein